MDNTTVVRQPFDFHYLHDFANNPSTSQRYIVRPFPDQNVLGLTLQGCVAAAGFAAVMYSRQDVYDRVILWRVPLIALAATTTLPSFSLHTQVFTIAHLLADPIDTIWSLLYKLHLAQRTAIWAQELDGTDWTLTFPSEVAKVESVDAGAEVKTIAEITNRADKINENLKRKNSPVAKYFHDVAALIVTAYDEWGYGEEASAALRYGFNKQRWNGAQRTAFRKRCAKAAFYIASDRVSRFLPSIASGVVFLLSISTGFWKTLDNLGNSYDETNPASAGLNRTPHNIAFGALFFWLPFVVLLTAYVGGSQTSHMMPKVLGELREDFLQLCDISRSSKPKKLSHLESIDLPDVSSEKTKRWKFGGLPVWQMDKFKDFRQPFGDGPSHHRFAWGGMFLSFVIVLAPTACAIAISWRTPTEGFGCRAMTQLSFLLMWTVNACMDGILSLCAGAEKFVISDTTKRIRNSRHVTVYWITFAKDVTLALATVATLTATALGIFNKCECWCKWPLSSGYISFPQDDYVFRLIKYRLSKEFPAAVGVTLLFQIVIFFLVWIGFRRGHQVLKQRDIDSVVDLN